MAAGAQAAAEAAQAARTAKSSKAAVPKAGVARKKSGRLRGSAAVPDGSVSMREAVGGPLVKPVAECCAAAHEDLGGDYCRLLDLLSASIAFESGEIALGWSSDCPRMEL